MWQLLYAFDYISFDAKYKNVKNKIYMNNDNMMTGNSIYIVHVNGT